MADDLISISHWGLHPVAPEWRKPNWLAVDLESIVRPYPRRHYLTAEQGSKSALQLTKTGHNQ